MSQSLASVAYIGATILFILSLGGLSNPETSRRGNLYGVVGMTIAVLATVLGPRVTAARHSLDRRRHGRRWRHRPLRARTVQMTQMPELVALMHSLVGLAAMLVGFATYIDPAASAEFQGAAKAIHEMEIYVGILIGAVTFSGSVIAFGKPLGQDRRQAAAAAGAPLAEPGRPADRDYFGREFLHAETMRDGMMPLIVMTAIALLFGIHMVMAIGGADMPVVVSMLNSYSGWAAAATGFMLSNDLLIVVGALVGSSGAILSYIMCNAMNRNFISVIAGGFGTSGGTPAAARRATRLAKSFLSARRRRRSC
ncbi:MAG: NAD(P)(+) transhydrogenase (Re/Si-specific) subunit beta [Verrucomicrobiota bacterium]